MTLPDGYVLRHPTEADADATQAVLDAAESHDAGEERSHFTNVAVHWMDPECRPDRDWWVVEASGHTIVAVAWLWPEGDGDLIADHYVHPGHRGRGLGEVLLDLIEEQVAKAPARLPDGSPRHLVVWCEDTDVVRLASLARRGFVAVRQYFEMADRPDRCVRSSRRGRPASSCRAFQAGEDERRVHAADQEAFAEHFLFEPRSFDAWRARHLEGDRRRPVALAPRLGRRRAGRLRHRHRSTREERMIDDLAVRKPWRGRGIGRALLSAAFAALRERGQTIARLYVDAQNVTNAVRVYEAAGMHVERRFDTLQKMLS